MLPSEGYCETALFRYLSNRLFASSQFRKNMSYEGQLFFENVHNLMEMSEVPKKIQKKPFGFEIICSELVALNCLY